jgi:deoxyribonucleoside regulator
MPEDDAELLARVAIFYYREKLTQKETAQRIGVSRQTIGRLLQLAHDRGIVRVEISSPIEEVEMLARQLEARFGMVEATVVVPDSDSDEDVKGALGCAAAALLRRRVLSGMILGLGWSTTMLKVVENLSSINARKVQVVQLDGGVPLRWHPNEAADIVIRAAEALDARAAVLMAPLFVDTSHIRDAVIADSQIASTLSLAARCDIAMFGVGAVTHQSTLFTTGYLSEGLITDLNLGGAVGEVLGRFYDEAGQPCGTEVSKRTIGLDLEALLTIPVRCAIAGGASKVNPTLAALKGKLCNVLVTDVGMAEMLLGSNQRG